MIDMKKELRNLVCLQDSITHLNENCTGSADFRKLKRLQRKRARLMQKIERSYVEAAHEKSN